MLDKAHELLDFKDYNDLFSKYETLPKISFDYAVVEKEPSIQTSRYQGDWKDVGTWNMMAEVMSDNAKGNVMLDETCSNSQAVNELDLPMLCMGCKDMIIVASSDGILVSDKNQSSYMKPYAEKIAGDVMFAEKSWGTYTVIDVQNSSLTIKVKLNAGHSMKYHSHQRREEVWTFVSGSGSVTIDGVKKEVNPGDVIKIPVGCKHTVSAKTDLCIIEVQLGSDIDVNDKTTYRL